MELDKKKKRIWAELIGPVAFALGMASVIFVIEQGFRWLAKQPCWPLAIGDLYLIVYFLIIIIGIGVGSGIARLRIAKNHSPKAFLFMALIVLFVMGLMVWKNYGKPWQEGYWLLRLMLVIGLFAMLLISGFRLFQNIKMIIGMGLIFTWVGWATLAPEGLLSWIDLYKSETKFVIFHSIILAIIGGMAYQNLKNISPRIVISVSLFILAGFIATAFTGPDKVLEPVSDARDPTRFAEKANNRPPNLFLIVLDTVRKDHLSLYGYKRDTSPFLKELAKESLVFTNFKTSAPWTLPAHASLFTGLYPHEHHADFMRESGRFSPLEGSFTTLAEILKEKGYATGGISANYLYTNQHYGLSQGFDYFYSDCNSSHILAVKMDLMRIIFNTGLVARTLATISRESDTSFYYKYYLSQIDAKEVNRRAQSWIGENCRNRPCFVFLNYMEAHVPYIPAEDYLNYYGEGLGKISYWGVPSGNWYMSRNDTQKVYEDRKALSAKDAEVLSSLYDAKIRFLDDGIKDYIQMIKEYDLYDNSLIIILSDHGEAFGEKNLLGHGDSLYEFEMAVPLIIKTPIIEKVEINDEMSSIIELLPYINSCLFNNTCKSGISMGSTRYMGMRPMQDPQSDSSILRHNLLALWENDLKIILQDRKIIEVYNYVNDAGETINLGEEIIRDSQEVMEIYDKIYSKEEQNKGAVKPISAEEYKKLKALGYIR